MLRRSLFFMSVGLLMSWCGASFAQTGAAERVGNQLLTGQNAAKANAGTVAIMTTRNLGSPFMQMTLDLSTLLDSGEHFEDMRVILMGARGKVQNLWDIMYLKGVDAAFVQADTLEYLRRDPRYAGKFASVQRNIRYIAVMPPEEVHIVARREIRNLRDLAGKTISINAKGTGSSVVGTLLFERLKIPARLVHLDTRRAIAQMKAGEIHAHINVLGVPARPVARVKSEDQLHLLEIPYVAELGDLYVPSKFTSDDYPELIPQGQTVRTIAARNVLAVYNWPSDNPRYRKVARFVQALFSRFGELQQKGFHPKWKDINLAATIPGWTRFGAAQDWLDKNRPAPVAAASSRSTSALSQQEIEVREQLRVFLESQQRREPNDAEVNALFNEFIQWRSQEGGPGAQ